MADNTLEEALNRLYAPDPPAEPEPEPEPTPEHRALAKAIGDELRRDPTPVDTTQALAEAFDAHYAQEHAQEERNR